MLYIDALTCLRVFGALCSHKKKGSLPMIYCADKNWQKFALIRRADEIFENLSGQRDFGISYLTWISPYPGCSRHKWLGKTSITKFKLYCHDIEFYIPSSWKINVVWWHPLKVYQSTPDPWSSMTGEQDLAGCYHWQISLLPTRGWNHGWSQAEARHAKSDHHLESIFWNPNPSLSLTNDRTQIFWT